MKNAAAAKAADWKFVRSNIMNYKFNASDTQLTSTNYIFSGITSRVFNTFKRVRAAQLETACESDFPSYFRRYLKIDFKKIYLKLLINSFQKHKSFVA